MVMPSTRKTLLLRIRNPDDDKSWQNFYDTYWGLIYSTARAAGLTDEEARDAAQETVIAVTKHIGHFEVDPNRASFRTWLGTITRSKIADQFRKRLPVKPRTKRLSGETGGTTRILRIADPVSLKLNVVWEEQWLRHLRKAALAKVQQQVNEKHYEIFKSYAIANQPVETVAQKYGVTPNNVYGIKNRLQPLFDKEIKRLRAELDCGASVCGKTAE